VEHVLWTLILCAELAGFLRRREVKELIFAGCQAVQNAGVDPDYVVPQRPDLVVEGHDPQLEKAIELAKEALKDYKGLPPRPKFPGSK